MFSSFRVVLNGDDASSRLGGKAKALLKTLLTRPGRMIPRDALMEMLWPEKDPAAGYVSLKVTAHKLRNALEPSKRNGDQGSWIVAQDGTYRLHPAADIWVDVEAFEAHWQSGKAYEVRGDLRKAREEYQKAEALYAGDYLEEDLYEDWAIVRREELRDVYLEIVGKLAYLSMKEHAFADAIRYCHKIVSADPCREDAYRMLMQCHARLNQLARAGAWYAVCRTMLKREMEADPNSQTVSVFEDLFSKVP